MTMRAPQVAKMRAGYLAGCTLVDVAAAADCTTQTVSRYFGLFAAHRLVRGKRPKVKPSITRDYYGPPMIGTAIGAPPVPIGPDWIGVAIAPLDV